MNPSPTRSSARLQSLALAAAAVLALTACETSPTGQRQLKLFPSNEVAQMGDTAYAQMLKQEKVVRGTAQSNYIECVARAVTAVVPAPEGGGRWEVSVFGSDQVNAFALPGGNIGIYTGLLKAARSPAQLAAVIGHEIAHVQAEHANARLSTQYATNAGLSVVQILGQGTALESQTAMGLLGLGAQVGVLLPFGRSQEREADVLGLNYMAMAGFDPRAAVQLWQNMAEVSGSKGPEFLSTHPANESRIAELRQLIPTVAPLYAAARRS